MSGRQWRVRWFDAGLVIGLIALLGGLVLLAVVLVTGGIERASSWASVLGTALAIIGAVVTLVTYWRRHGRKTERLVEDSVESNYGNTGSRGNIVRYGALGLGASLLLTVCAVLIISAAEFLAGETPSPLSPKMDIFDIPSKNSYPVGLASGPDGNIWFAEQEVDKIGRITPGGDIEEFPMPTIGGHPYAITAGPDGNLWFTEGKPDSKSGNRIGRITPSGHVIEFPLSTDSANPVSITSGPDGNIWFTEYNADKIGRISTDGKVITEFSIPSHPMEFPVPTRHSHPDKITTGADGALWFTEFFGNRIGRIATDGKLSEFLISTPAANPVDIISGSDGNLWFTEFSGNKIGRISTKGEFLEEVDLPTAEAGPAGIVVGPDNQVWFTELKGNKIGRIATDGKILEHPIPNTNNGQPIDIARGNNNTLWFTMGAGNQIGRIAIGR